MTLVEQVRVAGDLGRNASQAEGVYARLKGVVLLCGAVRPTKLSEGIQRSLLDLPVDDKQTLLDRWVEQAGEAAESHGIGHLSLMVMLDASGISPETGGIAVPAQSGTVGRVGIRVMRDPFEFRGTGGVLFDIARELADEDYLVVATGAQLLIEPLKELLAALEARRGDVAILGHRDGTPSGLMLVKCAALREIADVGFVDLKEQALPAIAKKHRVVVEHRETASYPVRTASDYLLALRHYHRRKRGEQTQQDPFAEDWKSEFSVVEAGAKVDPSARLFDSVVLNGGEVGAGAVLVRSVVCGGTSVEPGQRGVEALLSNGHHGRRRIAG